MINIGSNRSEVKPMLINLNGDTIVDTDSVAAFSKGDDVTYIEKDDKDYGFF